MKLGIISFRGLYTMFQFDKNRIKTYDSKIVSNWLVWSRDFIFFTQGWSAMITEWILDLNDDFQKMKLR